MGNIIMNLMATKEVKPILIMEEGSSVFIYHPVIVIVNHVLKNDCGHQKRKIIEEPLKYLGTKTLKEELALPANN